LRATARQTKLLFRTLQAGQPRVDGALHCICATSLAALPHPATKGNIMSDSNKKPAARVTLYPVTATIWRNESKDGETFYSTAFERRYKDKEGNWKGSTSFSSDELLLLAKVADLAHTEVVKLRTADRPAQQAPDSEAEAA